jgi:hypothetical protein
VGPHPEAPLTAIFFNLRSGVDAARRRALLRYLASRPEVSTAAALRPGATNEKLQRMFYANVDDDAAVGAVLDELRRHPEVESASLPSERHLVSGS